MRASLLELVKASEAAAKWIKKATLPNEVNPVLKELKGAIERAKTDLHAARSGYLIIVEIPDVGRRITVSVEKPDLYLSRSGLRSAGVQASILDSAEVPDVHSARSILREELDEEYFIGMGMGWSAINPAQLRAVMKRVALRAAGV